MDCHICYENSDKINFKYNTENSVEHSFLNFRFKPTGIYIISLSKKPRKWNMDRMTDLMDF